MFSNQCNLKHYNFHEVLISKNINFLKFTCKMHKRILLIQISQNIIIKDSRCPTLNLHSHSSKKTNDYSVYPHRRHERILITSSRIAPLLQFTAVILDLFMCSIFKLFLYLVQEVEGESLVSISHVYARSRRLRIFSGLRTK